MSSLHADVVVEALRCAFRFDVLAYKPGNVSVYAAGHDMAATDFLAAAAVAAPALVQTTRTIGATIHDAVAASVAATRCNTNLGIVLLAAPLARAALLQRPSESLRERLAGILSQLSVADASHVYAAIRLASPGGLGRSDSHDVADEPCITLLEAMRVAAVRDRIAYQYANDYCDVFEVGLPLLRTYRDRWQSLSWAAVGVYLALLARYPDSHVERKYGVEQAREVTAAAGALERGFKACENPAAFVPELKSFDRELKENGVNPGTSADLTVACLIALMLEHPRGNT